MLEVVTAVPDPLPQDVPSNGFEVAALEYSARSSRSATEVVPLSVTLVAPALTLALYQMDTGLLSAAVAGLP